MFGIDINDGRPKVATINHIGTLVEPCFNAQQQYVHIVNDKMIEEIFRLTNCGWEIILTTIFPKVPIQSKRISRMIDLYGLPISDVMFSSGRKILKTDQIKECKSILHYDWDPLELWALQKINCTGIFVPKMKKIHMQTTEEIEQPAF